MNSLVTAPEFSDAKSNVNTFKSAMFNLPSNCLPTGKSFQSIATKFPHPGLHIAVHPKAGPKKGTIKISPNKTLQSLFINVAASPKIHVPFNAAIIWKHMFGLFRQSRQSNPSPCRAKKDSNIPSPGRTRLVKCPTPGPTKTIKSPLHALPPLPPLRLYIDRCITI